MFIIVFLFFLENILYFHYFFLNRKKGVVLSSLTYSDNCSLDCQEMMDEKINRALARISGSYSGGPKSTSISYIPLGDGGLTISHDWVLIEGSQFVFDLNDYPSGTRVYWEGNLKARHSNSRCYARIYDKDNFREVDYSRQSTDKTSFESLKSNSLRIWAGNNHYQLEIKSLNGIPCYLETPRLIVKY